MKILITILLIALTYTSCNNNDYEPKKCKSDFDCGYDEYCSPYLSICRVACLYQDCGEDNGVACENKCSEELPYCSKANKCFNPCKGLECGFGLNSDIYCGSCNNDLAPYCSLNSCVPLCTEMQCGEHEGLSCGVCDEGDTCTGNTCLNIKQWREPPETTGVSVATDKNNNVYVLSGEDDLFLRKFNTSGIEEWKIVHSSSYGIEYGTSIKVDSDNNIYITGYTTGSFEGPIPESGKDIFLTKVDSNGIIKWTKQWGTLLNDSGMSLEIDSENNIYVTGYTGINEADIFLTKFNSDGLKEWTKQWGDEIGDVGLSIAINSNNDIYVTGYQSYNHGVGVYKQTKTRPFLTKFNTSGVEQYNKILNFGENIVSGRGLIVDKNNYIYIMGRKNAVYDLTTKTWDESNLFLSKLNEEGLEVWTKYFNNIYEGSSIALNSLNEIYITGELESKNIFLYKIDDNGNIKFTKRLGTSNRNAGKDLAIDSNDNIYITGYTYGDLIDGTASYNRSVFLIKFKE